MTAEPTRWAVASTALVDLPDELRLYREVLGLSLRSAASQAGVPLSVLYRVEKGEGASTKTLARLLAWLDDNVTVAERAADERLSRLAEQRERISRLTKEPRS